MTPEITTTPIQADPELREMIDAGVFYGRTRTRTNPRMKQFILTNRNGIEIINLEKTNELLKTAVDFVKERVAKGANLLVVGTQPSAVEAVEKMYKEFSIPAVTTRWFGGTLTNFRVISKRVDYWKKLKEDFASGAFQKYVKKERIKIQQEMEKLTGEMESLENLGTKPNLVIMVDPHLHTAAVNEAKKLKIPVVALLNTDFNPDSVDYPVPGNTKARASVSWFLEKVSEAVRQGRKESLKVTEKKEDEKENTEEKPLA